MEDDEFEQQMKGMVADVKAYEKASLSRPPPIIPKISDFKANVRAVVTLRTTDEATRLANELETFIQNSVDIFHQIDEDRNAKNRFVTNLHNMTTLFATFPPICLDDVDKDAATKYVDGMRQAQRTIESLLSSQRSAGKFGNSEEARKMAIEIRSILDKIIGVGRIMEDYQRKLLLLACKKATDAIVLLKHSKYSNQIDEKCRLYNMHIDNLLNLTTARANMLDAMKEDAKHKPKFLSACEELRRHRSSLESSTRSAVQTPGGAAEAQQQSTADAMLTAVQQIHDIVNKTVTKPVGDFDHTVSIQQQLDLLADAVKNKQGGDAARAAQNILNDLDGLKNPHAIPAEEDTDDPAARQALIDAANRLKELLKGLLAPAKEAIANPTPEAQKKFDKVLNDYKGETAQLKPLAEKVAHPPPKEYDSLKAELPGSGMIEAAAKAAAELAAIFNLPSP